MMHQFDHRWATYDLDGSVRDVMLAEKRDPSFSVIPRYWVQAHHVTESLKDRWDKKWMLGWRDIARATDERTLIAPVFPVSAVGNKVPIMLTGDGLLLSTVLNAFVTDFVIRQSAGGTSLNYFIVKQVAVTTPAQIDTATWLFAEPRAWFEARAVELSATTHDLALDETPFEFDSERRAHIRAELDAAYFHLYGLDRGEAEYVMETFPIVRKKDEAVHGNFRTKHLILEAYDAMALAMSTGTTFRSILTSLPGDGPRRRAPNREAAMP